jgi:hypothetical protein
VKRVRSNFSKYLFPEPSVIYLSAFPVKRSPDKKRTFLSKSSVKQPPPTPPWSPNGFPMETDAPFPEPSFAYPSEFSEKESSLEDPFADLS